MEGCRSLAIVALLSCVQMATGGIAVTDEHGWPVATEHWTLSSSPMGYTLVLHGLHSPWQETWYVVEADAQEHFQEIRLDIDGPAAGSPVFVRLEAGSIDVIEQTGDAEIRLDHVAVGEDLGRVESACIGTLIAGNDITGPIICTTAPNPVRGIHEVTAGRAVRGDLLAEHGVIGAVTAAYIGTAQDPVAIRSRYGLQALTVNGDAHLELDLRTSDGTGLLGALTAGSVHGHLAIDGCAAGAQWHLTDLLAADVVIGGGMEGMDPVLHLPLGALHGQVVLNADDDNGAWTAPVYFGESGDDLLLHGPAYGESPVELGGGSIGLVPFRLHDSACMPGTGQTASNDVQPVLRWYGPVTWPDGVPLLIERRATDAAAWELLPPETFYCAPVPGDANAIRIEPGGVGAGFESGWTYRVRPSTALRCATPSLPAVSMGDAWTIEIDGGVCPGDLDGDGHVAVADLLVLIACWGAVDDPLSSAADLDDNAQVDIVDLLMMISQWGPCS